MYGYAAIFNTRDSYNSEFTPGAFKKTIEEGGPKGKRSIKFVYDHINLIGIPSELREDNTGLWFSAPISKTSLGDDVLQLYNDGALTDMSFAFRSMRDNVATKDGEQFRQISEVQLFEIGPVLWGSNPNAKIQGIRSLSAAIPDLIQEARSMFAADPKSEELTKIHKELTLLTKALESTAPSHDTRSNSEPLYKEVLNEIRNLKIQAELRNFGRS